MRSPCSTLASVPRRPFLFVFLVLLVAGFDLGWAGQGGLAASSIPASDSANSRTAIGPQLRARPFELTFEDRQWWSFRSPVRVQPPRTRSTPLGAHPIDLFLRAKLEPLGIEPNPPATRRELIRRASMDLTGLLPSPEETETFEANAEPGAWERLIDRLLGRPEYGERWARHWLDLVRFAESNGYERDAPKPNAWRYRDYVIQSFDRDKAYDRFILEQLAGDELDGGYSEESIIATGFYRLHVWDDEPDSTLAAEFDDLDDVMVTTGAAFLGLTLGCARCHDHKYDPISHQDYYRTLAYFRSINPYGQHKTGGGGRGTGRITRALAPPETIRRWELEKAERTRPFREALASAKDEEARKRWRLEIQKIEDHPPFGFALAVQEDPIKPTHVFRRGDVLAPAEEVQPGVPEVLAFMSPQVRTPRDGASSGRRLGFARWVADPGNPLTARVMVNRLWRHHFGRGLVETPNDFGRTGSPPSHPELLDMLAAEFIAQGWSIKRMHRFIMTSEAYRMSSKADRSVALGKDESNELFWRQNSRRMEAEALRDSILATSGSLHQVKGGPGFYPSLPKEVHRTQDSEGKGWQTSAPREQARRSIYSFVKRALLPPLLEAFDFTATTVPVGERSVTTVAPQALMLLNDDFVRREGEAMVRRLDREVGSEGEGRVLRAFQLSLQRKPTPSEMEASLAMVREQERLISSGPGRLSSSAAWREFCVALFNLNEFLHID